MPLSGSYTGVGVAPTVLEAYGETANRVRVVFSEPMALSAELQDPASYTITEDMGSAARTVDAVSVEPAAYPTYVLLILDGALTVGSDNYNVEVDDAVTDRVGNVLDAAADDADFSGVHTMTPIDHCEAALARLLTQFRQKPLFEGLICALAEGAQPLEQAGQDLRAFRALGTAFGEQLDGIGQNLRQPREGVSDSDYRVILNAKVLVLACKGRPDELLTILTTLDDGFDPGAIAFSEQFPAAYVMRCHVPGGNQLRGERYARMVREAKPAGVYFELEFEEEGRTLLSWSEVSGSDPAPPVESGFEEEDDPGIGGIWQEASAGVNT